MTDFSNHAERRVWLEKQSREVCVAMANRAAMRVFPMAVLPAKAKDTQRLDLTGATKWALLISAVAVTASTAEIKDAASAALSAASAFSAATAAAAFSAAAVAAAAAPSSAFSASSGSSFTTSFSAAASAAAAAASDAAAIDQGTTAPELLALPLWPDKNPLLEDWQKARKILESDPVDQSFWIDWYERFLQGQPQNWEMLQEIALSVKKDDWEKGSAHVNGMIADIQARYISEALPQADRLAYDPKTGLFEIVAIKTTEEKIVEAALSQIEFALSVAAGSNCGVNEHSTVHVYITHALKNCRDNPNTILQNYQIALADIREGLESGDYFDDPKLSALEMALAQQIDNLLANHPEVKKAELVRVKHILSIARVEEKIRIVNQVKPLKDEKEAKFKNEQALDQNLFLQENPSKAQTKATQRYFGRIAQWYTAARKAAANAVLKTDASAGYKLTKLVQTLGKIVAWIMALGG